MRASCSNLSRKTGFHPNVPCLVTVPRLFPGLSFTSQLEWHQSLRMKTVLHFPFVSFSWPCKSPVLCSSVSHDGSGAGLEKTMLELLNSRASLSHGQGESN